MCLLWVVWRYGNEEKRSLQGTKYEMVVDGVFGSELTVRQGVKLFGA